MKREAGALTDLAARYDAVFYQTAFQFRQNHEGPSDAELAEVVVGLKDVKTPISLLLDSSKQLIPSSGVSSPAARE